MPKHRLIVSDHAVLRWIERVYLIDLEEIREEIRAIAQPAVDAGATRMSVQGVTIMWMPGSHDRMIVTTITPAASPSASLIGATMAHGGSEWQRDDSRQALGRYLRRQRGR